MFGPHGRALPDTRALPPRTQPAMGKIMSLRLGSLSLGTSGKSAIRAVLLGSTVLVGLAQGALAAPADDLQRRLEALEKNLALQSKQIQQQQELIEQQSVQIQDLKR